jgi:muramoyltetrapeptide carboxypeptidase
MKRKNFIKTLGAAAIFTTPLNNFNKAASLDEIQKIKPKRLKKGDTVGLAAPGSFITEDELQQSIKNLEDLGFKVHHTKRILSRTGYLGGNDTERAEDLNEMFADKNISAIMCARGGYGCARILPLLNYDLIKKNPKVIIGYSDITSLLYGIYARTGLIGFHGPVGISTFNDYSKEYFEKVLMNPSDNLTLYNAKEDDSDNSYKVKTIKSGKASGELAGGNLSIVVSMIGTPYDIDTKDKIIFLEEIGEEPYRIDRMLTQLIQSGKLTNANGIALGVFRRCEAKPSDSGITNSFTLEEVLFDRLSDLGIPVVYGMSFGHITNKITLPIGVKAELNSVEATLKLLEPAVI